MLLTVRRIPEGINFWCWKWDGRELLGVSSVLWCIKLRNENLYLSKSSSVNRGISRAKSVLMGHQVLTYLTAFLRIPFRTLQFVSCPDIYLTTEEGNNLPHPLASVPFIPSNQVPLQGPMGGSLMNMLIRKYTLGAPTHHWLLFA